MMRQTKALFLLLSCALIAPAALARPYAGISGLAATADSAETAGNNPAGITRFADRAYSLEFMLFTNDAKWESQFSETGRDYISHESSETLVPRVAFIQPINDRLGVSLTFLGASFDDDFGNWPGRYFIESYNSLLISAFPSLAYKINEQWSVAGSAAISYSSFEQERAVRNSNDPGFGDGRSKIETDSVEYGWGASTLYQYSDRTRFGLTYQSKIEQEQEGDNQFSNLGPRTEEIFKSRGLLGQDVTVTGTRPQSVLLGMYHEFENAHAFTVDLIWNDFSEFRLSEFYFDGESYPESKEEYNDLYAITASYSFPVSERWMLGVSGAVTNSMIDDDDRTMTLRMDQVWTAAVAAEWQWKDNLALDMSVAYVGIDDAPVETPAIPVLGSLKGKYARRDTWLFQVALKWGSL